MTGGKAVPGGESDRAGGAFSPAIHTTLHSWRKRPSSMRANRIATTSQSYWLLVPGSGPGFGRLASRKNFEIGSK